MCTIEIKSSDRILIYALKLKTLFQRPKKMFLDGVSFEGNFYCGFILTFKIMFNLIRIDN